MTRAEPADSEPEHGSNLKPAGRYSVLGVSVDALQIPDVIDRMKRWIKEPAKGRWIAVTGMHGVTEAQSDPALKRALNSASLVVADGMPLVWLGRRKGFPMKRRVYGPELMEEFLRITGTAYRHYLYGGGEGVAEQLRRVIEERYGSRVVGTFVPPFRALTAQETEAVRSHINAARPDVVWVGLSTPKQERWMADNCLHLSVPVMVGVGAAFDFLAGLKPQAPRWMQEHGLEWLYRLSREPRRLARRYLLGIPKFAYLLVLETLHLRSFTPSDPP